MENSVFLDKTAEWLERLGLPYISRFEAGLILTAAFIALLMIFWLVFRKARLWYWKTNIQIDTLKSIDGRLQNVEDKLSGDFFGTTEKEECGPPEKDENGQPSETVQIRALTESGSLASIGKSGRIYTEAELELQIRE